MSLWEHTKDQCNASKEQVDLVDESLDLCESLTELATKEAWVIQYDVDNVTGDSDKFQRLKRLRGLAYERYKRRAEPIT